MRAVTVLGGYGVFGGRIAEALARHPGTRVRIAGRDARVGANFAHRIGADFRTCMLEDSASLRAALEGSAVVVHAAGPFQGADYRVASACLDAGAHYLDLSDGREFVAGIGVLDQAARNRGLLVTSGASSTPAITSAMVRELAPAFAVIDEIHTALSPGNQNPRGASTIAAVLTYLGRKIRCWDGGQWVLRDGWGDAQHRAFPPPVGRRRVHNCDVPELALFPAEFGARTVRFQAGLELSLLNSLLALCRWPAQLLGWRPERQARTFLNLTLMLFPLGSKNGALAVWVRGRDPAGATVERRLAIVTDSDGPATPSAPAIILARKLLDRPPPRIGAVPCMGLITFDEIVAHLRPLGVWSVRGDESGWHVPPATKTV
jgi:hypothetical protein